MRVNLPAPQTFDPIIKMRGLNLVGPNFIQTLI
jgi:hypothetical protein